MKALEINDMVRCNNCMLVQSADISVCSKCKTDEYLMQPFSIANADQARETALDWQTSWQDHNYSYGELADWQAFFKKVAKHFRLTNEFKENGII